MGEGSGTSRPSVMRSARKVCLEMQLDVSPTAVREGRHFVEAQVTGLGADGFIDDAALVASELLANAVQHGTPPISICVTGDAEGVRIEVYDANPRGPVPLAPSAGNMTGRGLALVNGLTQRWGCDRVDDGGKVVWAELATALEPRTHEAEQFLTMADEDVRVPGVSHYTVVLGDVPTDLLLAAKAHIDNLVREFSLAAAEATGDLPVPEDLARLIETVVHGFADARDSIKRQALASAQRGDPRTSLRLQLPLSAAAAGEAYLAALDEADAYSRAARLLTLETPAPHRLFRRWYVEAVINQLRAVAAGTTPEPVTPFETRLLQEVQRLAAAQRAMERGSRLQRVVAGLAQARTPEDVAEVVISQGVAALGASGGGLLLPAGDGEHVAVPGVVGYGPELVDALREERLDAPLPGATALRTGQPIWLESQAERDERFPALRGFEGATVSMCAVPLIVAGRVLGALRFSFAARKLFDDDERDFVLALAAQTAQTLQRTELYAAERQASLDLQRALLPADVPDIAGWDAATYYSPAGDQEAGGDFYDVLPLPDGRVAAIVGDVMGRGIDAAAAMAQLRTMIRAYAVDDPGPLRVLRKVDRFLANVDVAPFATVLYCLLEPSTGEVEIASAGHLPPLLVRGNKAHTLAIPTGTPLAVTDWGRESARFTLSSGEAIVAITDGLVERRDSDIDEGIERVIRAIGDGPEQPSAEMLIRCAVKASAAEGLQDDDVTVFVLRRD